jgi:predicted double-glycine peptidase
MGFVIPKFSKKNYPLKYMITKENRIDIQNNFECSAYSSAYLMRHFGIMAHGEELYKIMPNKMKNGCVYPKGILKLMKQQGFKAAYCKGNIAQLKKEVSKGIPVIVFIKVYKNKSWLHYVPVAGYDEDNLYIADSLNHLINASNIYYNRKISTTEF